MPHSLANILVHVVFSTKDRIDWIRPEIEEELFGYLASLARSLGCSATAIGGVDDHIHILCLLARTIAISKLVHQLKTSSSSWIKTKGGDLASFYWQNGYGAFSVGVNDRERVRRYIQRQREHHVQVSFKDEYRGLLCRAGLQWDEQYVWD